MDRPEYRDPRTGQKYKGPRTALNKGIKDRSKYISDRSMVPIFLVVHGSLYLKINYEIRPVKIKNLFYLAELFFFGREK